MILHLFDHMKNSGRVKEFGKYRTLEKECMASRTYELVEVESSTA